MPYRLHEELESLIASGQTVPDATASALAAAQKRIEEQERLISELSHLKATQAATVGQEQPPGGDSMHSMPSNSAFHFM